MTTKKNENLFGLDKKATELLNWDLALKRVMSDLKSDFIWAPHISFLYRHAGEKLIDQIKSELNAGTFSPGVPLTIEVPKSFRIQVAGPNKRLGPSFSRPGSVLPPKDRIFYQLIADEAASIIQGKTDHTRSFSHRLADATNEAMFEPSRKCWGDMQAALKLLSQDEKYRYILKTDISDYFGSINQHVLINTLVGNGFNHALADRLEKMLLSYSGQRSSRGILQGIYPSDLFGAFYMHPIDRFFDDNEMASVRYVDDMYIFCKNVDSAEKTLRLLIPELRAYDLKLNEVKSAIVPKTLLFTEEPDLELLFKEAVDEITNQTFDGMEDGYGFQQEWDGDDSDVLMENADDDENIDIDSYFELEATKQLFTSIDSFPGHEEHIERFCLPLFAKAKSDFALEHVKDALKKRPSMTQIYASYLEKFIEQPSVYNFLKETIKDNSMFDWQRMWIIAAMSSVSSSSDETVKIIVGILNDGTRHDALRAVAAVFVGRFGDPARRKTLFSIYPAVSEYVQIAIYFSSQKWPNVEKRNARASWGSHGALHKLMSECLSNE